MPRILFPFAREIVATSVRNGGFPPLMLDPIDFIALYQQRLAQGVAAPRRSSRSGRIAPGRNGFKPGTIPLLIAKRKSCAHSEPFRL